MTKKIVQTKTQKCVATATCNQCKNQLHIVLNQYCCIHQRCPNFGLVQISYESITKYCTEKSKCK